MEPTLNDSLRLKVFSSWKELESLQPIWDRLLLDSVGPSMFSTWEWLSAWWEAFGQGKRLVATVFTEAGGEVVGLAPLYLDLVEVPFPRHLKELRFVGDGSEDSDNLNFTVRSGYEDACARTFANWLACQSNWDLCELNTLPADSVVGNALLRDLKRLGWMHAAYPRPRSAVDLPDSWESYLKQVSRKERTKLGYRSRLLESRYQVRFRKCTRDDELPRSLEALFRLHRMRWQLQGQEGTFASEARRKFYYLMARSFLARQWLEFWLLELNGTAVAAQFGFRYGQTVYSLQEGFDPAYSQMSVAYVLRGHVLKQLIADGVRRYDFLSGLDPAKERWGALPDHYVDIHFAKPFTLGSAYLRLVHNSKVTKEWLRAELPSPLFRAIRWTYRRIRPARGPVARP